MTLVAFDLDGTLEDSRNDMVASVQRVRKHLGLPQRPDQDFRPHVNRGMGHLYEVCFEEYLSDGVDADRSELVQLYTQDYGRHIVDETPRGRVVQHCVRPKVLAHFHPPVQEFAERHVAAPVSVHVSHCRIYCGLV